MTNNKTNKPLYKLFLALLLYSILAGAFGCTPEQVPANKPASPLALRCGWVAHKYYQNPPADTTLANRTYWLQWIPDTVCGPANPNCGIYYDIQVPKACWDTMLPCCVSGTRYCQ